MTAKDLVVVMGALVSAMLTGLFSGVFWAAYADGYSATIYINKFGEAVPELVMWLFVYVVMTLSLYYVLEEYAN